MKKRLSSIIFLFLITTHVVIPINAAQAEQKSWFSSLFSGGVDLIKQHLVMAMFAALVYKAQEYGTQKEAAEDEIKLLQEKLKAPDITEKDKNAINAEIKKQEAIRDQKKTLAQKVAQVTLGVMGVAVAGGIAWTLWKPYPQRERDPNAMNVAELRQYLELMNAGMTSDEALMKVKGKKISIEDFLKK